MLAQVQASDAMLSSPETRSLLQQLSEIARRTGAAARGNPHVHFRERQVYSSGKESRTQRNTDCQVVSPQPRRIIRPGLLTDLHQEPIKRERVLVQHDPPSIPNHLRDATPEYGESKGIRPPFESEDEMEDQGQSKEHEEGDIPSQRRSILVDAVGGRADGEGAIGVWTVGDIVFLREILGH